MELDCIRSAIFLHLGMGVTLDIHGIGLHWVRNFGSYPCKSNMSCHFKLGIKSMVWGLPKTFGHCENPGHPQVMLYQISCHSWARPVNPSLHWNPHSAPQRTLPHRGLWCPDSTRRRPQSLADPGWIWLDPAVPGLVPTSPAVPLVLAVLWTPMRSWPHSRAGPG